MSTAMPNNGPEVIAEALAKMMGGQLGQDPPKVEAENGTASFVVDTPFGPMNVVIQAVDLSG